MINPVFVQLIHEEQERELMEKIEMRRKAAKPEKRSINLRSLFARLRQPVQRPAYVKTGINPGTEEEAYKKPCTTNC